MTSDQENNEFKELSGNLFRVVEIKENKNLMWLELVNPLTGITLMKFKFLDMQSGLELKFTWKLKKDRKCFLLELVRGPEILFACLAIGTFWAIQIQKEITIKYSIISYLTIYNVPHIHIKYKGKELN